MFCVLVGNFIIYYVKEKKEKEINNTLLYFSLFILFMNMKFQLVTLFEFIEKKENITSDELLLFCYSDPRLPNNRSDIYSLISILKSFKILEKQKNGLYKINKINKGVLYE